MIRLIIALIVAGIASAFLGQEETVYSPEKETVIQQAVYMAMTQAHLQPIKLNDSFSEKVYDQFFEILDGRKRFFIQSDLDKFESFRYEIDDMFKAADLTFFDQVIAAADEKIAKGKQYYQAILAEPFDFTTVASIETDYKKVAYAEDEVTLRDRWTQRLKYYTLQELESRITAQEKVARDSIKTISELEIESRNEIKRAYDRWYENYEDVRRSDRFEQYINVITRQFDPHSAYYSPKGKQDFNMRMGGKLEGIGAQLMTVGDLTQVVTVVPGGPVWKDERIEVNDFILKVAQKGEETVDLTGMRIDDVVSLIRGPKGSHVVLTIQKKDESQIIVELERDVINLEIARARGALLMNEGSTEQYGYIDLPMFYNSFDGPEGNSSAKDVAQLISMLKEKNINGLILDLRDNLGGALIDAIDISGLFIEEGPIVQVKSRDRRPYIHRDNNASVSYDGPLIVLVNNYSASASEIVAGALQDYGRAVVVGSQTFGKGSVQNFIDLDRAIRNNDEVKPLGEVKLTIQKYYRVNGESTQLKGVLPDVTLPDSYDLIPTGERENPGALAWSRLEEVKYGQKVFTYNDIPSLIKKSDARVSSSDEFALIKEYAAWLKDNKDRTSNSLVLEDYMRKVKELKDRNERYESILDKPVEGLIVAAIPIDFDSEISVEEKEARAEAWQKGVKQDFYIEEAMAIMADILKAVGYVSAVKK